MSALAPATGRQQPEAPPRPSKAWLGFALGAALVALWLASRVGVHTVAFSDLLDTIWAAGRALAAAIVLFGLGGFGVVRFFLPDSLRRYEVLWVLPVGACAAAILLTVFGFAAIPFKVGLGLTLATGAATSLLAYRRRGLPARPDASGGLAAWVAGLLVLVALAPYFAAGFPTVIGTGSDAHLAAGSAEFLRHSYPTSVNADLPIDQMPLVWRSKHPIYYALGAVSSLSGLNTWEALAPVAALLLGLAATGIFLLARELLLAGVLAAVSAAGAAGLDRMVLHTGMHPYFNQTWGYFTLPFSLVLGWRAVRDRDRAAAALLLPFLLLGAFAYPLALPIPLLAIAVFYWVDRRQRRARGEEVASLSLRGRLWRGRRSLLWMIPVGLLLIVPLFGVVEKSATAADLVVNPNSSLSRWGGDLVGFFPAHQFFSIASPTLWPLAFAALIAAGAYALRQLERPLAYGLGATCVVFLLFSLWFRQRDFGWYFEFKALAFTGPLIVAAAAAGAGRLRRFAPVLIGLLLVSAVLSAKPELQHTGHQIEPEVIGLGKLDRALPLNASVRLDARPNEQIWIGYMLPRQRLCALFPLVGTSYPHVPFSRDAQYILVDRKSWPLRGKPEDAAGQPLRVDRRFTLWRAKADVPGLDACSRRMIQTVKKIV